ncbi:nitroreductase family protein [Pseudonocardia hispaniensis]|uniref:Nitroreductase family protein n=1 Tax=Pseudonocardia hispaniensis TaxID=904933 RepID=A0ABW1J0T4_9PSEU
MAGAESASHSSTPLLSLTTEELLTTTRTVRRRLDLERPVARADVERAIEIALQAPRGGNKGGLRWLVIDDAATKQSVGAIWGECAEEYLRRLPADDPMVPGARRLQQVMGQVPMLVIPTIQGCPPQGSNRVRTASFWGSVLPAMWSFMLALRAKGMGSAWTQIHLAQEERVARILGIPSEVTQAGLLPVAWTIGTRFKPARRERVEKVVAWNAW